MSDLYEEVNPVFNTAKMTLNSLVQVGVAEATEFEKALTELEPQKSRFSPDEKVVSEKSVEAINNFILELRYHAANREIELAGNGNVLDLACGYTPRGKYLLDKGYRYVGGDLPAVIKVMNRLNEKLMNGRCTYLPVDLTNEASVLAAADKTGGPVTVTGEGVTMYLTMPEKEAMMRSIRDVLAKHGGVWITTDFEISTYFLVIGKAMLGDNFLETLMKDRAEMNRQSDASAKSLTLDEAKCMLDKFGFSVEKHPLWSSELHLTRLDNCSDEIREKLVTAIKTLHIWVMRLNEGVSTEPHKAAMYGVEITHTVTEGHLSLALRGRLDSISSPQLLELFRNVIDKQEIRRITVSASELEYISSAGLRVMMLMTKHVGQGNFTLKQPNESVRSIMVQTDFSDMLGL